MLTPPAFKKDAVPSTRGWHDPNTGELLTSRPMSQADVDEYNGVVIPDLPVDQTIGVVVPDLPVDQTIIEPDMFNNKQQKYEEDIEQEAQLLVEADPVVNDLLLEDLSKKELKDLCDQHGISYGWTTSKSALISKLNEVM